MSTTISQWAADMAKGTFPAREITPSSYAAMRYPRLLPMMRFTCHQYELEGFGNLFTMDTRAMGGMMALSTVVFTPSAGAAVPFLLIDTMHMKKKHLSYVEYYDCTASGAAVPGSENQRDEFASLADYAEKPAWYVARRTPYSLIKGGKGANPQALEDMVRTCVTRYLSAAAAAPRDPANLDGLYAFQQDMLELGNPASATLNRVLGEQGAREMFRSAIMPVGKG